VYTDTGSYHEWTRVAGLCHDNSIHFISADLFGLVARVFVDFGKDFIVTDTNGEQPLTGHIGFVSQACPDVL
jgi:ubiquitin-activating enzyme E1